MLLASVADNDSAPARSGILPGHGARRPERQHQPRPSATCSGASAKGGTFDLGLALIPAIAGDCAVPSP